MSSVGVATGHPDGEDRPMPHGGTLLDGSALSVNGATNLPGISGFVEVAGYRSLVVAIKNNGTTALVVTPTWEFYEGSVALGLTDAQAVPAGESRRLLFQNHGDILKKVAITGGGAGDTIDYHVVPSNLDPFSTTVKVLNLVGVNAGVQTIPVGAGGAKLQFQESGAISYIPNPELFSFDYSSAGIINAVHILHEGLYGISWKTLWSAPTGAYSKSVIATATATPGIPNASVRVDTSFDAVEVDMSGHAYFVLSPAQAVAANNVISLTAIHGNGVGVLVEASLLQIVQFASRRP